MRFYNSGKYIHTFGRHKDTGEMVETVHDLKPSGHDVGTAIVNFPGHLLCKAVKAGEWIDLPSDLDTDAVKRACPSLLTEAEAAPLIAAANAAAPKPQSPGKAKE